MRRTNGSFIGLSVVLIACSGNGTGEKSTGNSGGSANSESTVQTGGKTAACETGNEGCPCYPNKTCNDDLTCASRLCVSLGAGGNSGNPSSNAQGGTIAIAGSEVTVVGGTISTGGTGSSNGGQPSVGGSLTLGGTSATGSNVGNGGKTSAGSDSGGYYVFWRNFFEQFGCQRRWYAHQCLHVYGRRWKTVEAAIPRVRRLRFRGLDHNGLPYFGPIGRTQ